MFTLCLLIVFSLFIMLYVDRHTTAPGLFNHLFKLKHLESKYKNVAIAHDMTKNERKDCKTLVEEAKKTRGGTFGKQHIQGQGSSRGNDNCPALPIIKHKGNQSVNKLFTDYN